MNFFKIKLFFLIFCFYFALFSIEEDAFFKHFEAEERAKEEYNTYVSEIQKTIAEDVKRDLDLYCSGSNGIMREKIVNMGLSFIAFRRATVKEARALHLLIIDKFVKAVNSHEKIQPFLEIVPFSYEKAQVSISFMKRDIGEFCDGTVAHMMNVTGDAYAEKNRNKLFYSSCKPFSGSFGKLLIETYEEAVAINSADPVVHPEIHQKHPKEEILDQFLDSFARKIPSEFGFYCKDIGGDLVDQIELIAGKFVMFQPVDQNQARQVIVTLAEKLLTDFNKIKELEPYYNEHPFPSKRIQIRIEFRTKDDQYYYGTSISDVELENDIITFYEEIDSYSTIPDEVGKENYSDALEIVKTVPVSTRPSFWFILASFFGSILDFITFQIIRLSYYILPHHIYHMI